MSAWAKLPVALVCLPFVAAAMLAAPAPRPARAWIDAGAALATFLVAAGLAGGGARKGALLGGDALGVHFALLTSFVAFGTVLSSLAWRREGRRETCLDRAAGQCLTGGMLLSLLAREPGLVWIGAELACISAAFLVGLRRTQAAIRATRHLGLSCGLGLGLALFGTVLIDPAAGAIDAGFVFLLLGYATIAALAPLHTWLPDAEAEAPRRSAGLLTPLLPNIGLVAIVRVRDIASSGQTVIPPGWLIAAFGVISVLAGAAGIWSARDGARLTAYAIIAGNGAAAIAFGLGGVGPTAAGVMQMTLLTLTGAAAAQCTVLAAAKGMPFSERLRTDPALRLTLLACLVALTGFPPLGVFSGLFLVATETARHAWPLAILLGLGFVAGAAGLIRRAQAFGLGPAPEARREAPVWVGALAPVWLLLAITLVLGLGMPAAMGGWMTLVAGGAR